MSLEIDEGSIGGYFWEAGETTDSCSQEQMSQDLPKLASSKKERKKKSEMLRCIVLFLPSISLFPTGLKVLSQFPKHTEKEETNIY